MQYFNYDLPESYIAQRHASYQGRREDSKLLHLSWNKESFVIKDSLFKESIELFQSGDLLVFNDTKVLHARFFCEVETVQELEVLLIEKVCQTSDTWKALARPMKKLKSGMSFPLSGRLSALVQGRTEDERFILLDIYRSDTASNDHLSVDDIIREEGYIPIPPYIRQGKSDSSDKMSYQTVFAKEEGSVAAPTAGLHFSESVLSQIRAKGVEVASVTLHVGAGSFLPVKDPHSHEVFEERFFISRELWEKILFTRKNNGRVIAVGTTVLRTLETIGSSVDKDELLSRWSTTDLFIRPGFSFSVVDVLFTNFHQPSSTHLLLVEAFIGREAIESVYEHAMSNEYRFLSYGDTSCLQRRSHG